MSKKTQTPPSEIDTQVSSQDGTATTDVVVEELYDATLTKTVKHGGGWHYPGAVFIGIGVDFAAELQSANAADITAHVLAEPADESSDPEIA